MLTVSDRFADYARAVVEHLRVDGVRADRGSGQETLGKAIREATTEKVPNVLVIGEREVEEETVTLRRYGQRAQEIMAADEFRARVASAIRKRTKTL